MSTSSEIISERQVAVARPHGLHARPGAQFVQSAQSFRADIQVRNLSRPNDRPHNAKSLTDLLLAAVDEGHVILITARGSDAHEAADALAAFAASSGEGVAEAGRRLGNALRRSTASPQDFAYRNVPLDWPTEDWYANYWTVSSTGVLEPARAVIQLPSGYASACRRIEIGEPGCLEHVRRWGVAFRMSRLEQIGFDPSTLPAPEGESINEGTEILRWMMRATHFELPGDFIIASPEHPLLLFAPDGTLAGYGGDWFTHLGALAFYVSGGKVAKPFLRLWRDDQPLYYRAVFYLLRALGGQDDSQDAAQQDAAHMLDNLD